MDQLQDRKQDLHGFFLGLFGYPELSDAIINSFDSHVLKENNEDEREDLLQAEFEKLVERVVHDIRKHPRYRDLLQFYSDQSQLSDADVVGLFDFIYSGFVCHFKGQLAEVLARPILGTFANLLQKEHFVPCDLTIVPGYTIMTVQGGNQAQKRRWRQGPDALLIARMWEGDARAGGASGQFPAKTVSVAGIAEIKSYRESPGSLFEQVASHLTSLQCGFRLGSTEFPPSEIAFILPTPGKRSCSVPAGTPGLLERIPSLVVRPKSKNRPARPMTPLAANVWSAELAYTQSELMEAGFRLTDWLLTSFAEELFGADRGFAGIPPEERVKNPWPELPPEKAGRSAVTESIYYLGLRNMFDGDGVHARARRTFLWLYNSLSFGYSNADGKRMHAPEEHLDLPRAPDDPDFRPSPTRDPSWRDAMAAYRAGRFQDALAVFPDPGSKPKKLDLCWTRDIAMIARLNARCGRGSEARANLSAVDPLSRWPYPALPIEVHAITALSFLADGDESAARRELNRAVAALESVRKDRDERKARQAGPDPWLDVGTVHMAILDIVAVMAALGEHEQALAELVRLGNVDPWVFEYVSADALLSPLLGDPVAAARIDAWKRHSLEGEVNLTARLSACPKSTRNHDHAAILKTSSAFLNPR